MGEKELLFRYGIVTKDDESENPDFINYECCKTHPLCEHIHSSKKMFSRSEIELISAKLGYPVFDNVGGNDKCQCKWKSFIVTKKD